jgi:hypothetical protein
MYEDENNIVWVCTVGAGLGKYDYRRSTFEIIEPVKKYAIYVRHLLPDGHCFGWLPITGSYCMILKRTSW